jgi:hypothetical protein
MFLKIIFIKNTSETKKVVLEFSGQLVWLTNFLQFSNPTASVLWAPEFQNIKEFPKSSLFYSKFDYRSPEWLKLSAIFWWASHLCYPYKINSMHLLRNQKVHCSILLDPILNQSSPHTHMLFLEGLLSCGPPIRAYVPHAIGPLEVYKL